MLVGTPLKYSFVYHSYWVFFNRRCTTEILTIRRTTVFNQSINQSSERSIEDNLKYSCQHFLG